MPWYRLFYSVDGGTDVRALGLDVFYCGGWIMHLHLQRYLMFFALLASSFSAFASSPSWTHVSASNTSAVQWCDDNPHCLSVDYYRTDIEDQFVGRMLCPSNPPLYPLYTGTGSEQCPPGKECYLMPDGGSCVTEPPQECATPNILDPETGECLPPESTPEECREIGQAYNPLTKQCVEECEHGTLNGVCLPPPEPDQECTKDSADYRGVLVQGYGKPVIPACGDFDQCADGKPGKVGLLNGELRCIADDYGQENECAADEIFIVDQYGVICAGLEDTPEEEPTPEDPNTDTDGDGQPDEYNPDNDPNINRKQLDQLNKNQQKGNESLKNLERIGKGTNDRLDDISGGMDDLVGLTGQINDKLEAPDGGFDISGFLNAPTMSESAQGMADYVSQTGYGQLLATLSSFPTSANCPVYTIPATDYWGALTMDVHCQVLADYRGLFSALFMFFWSVTALFVFFRA